MGNRQRGNWKTLATLANMVGGVGLAAANPFMGLFFTLAGSGIINALFTAKPADNTDSPSYDWRHTPNQTASHENPLPILYGTARIKPVVKNRYVEQVGDKQYLNILYSITGHKIDEVAVGDTVPGGGVYRGPMVGTSLNGGKGTIWSPPASLPEPGKTYRARKDTVTFSNYLHIGTTDTGNDDWEVWTGTAAVSGIQINGNPVENYLTANSDTFRFETRPGLAVQEVIDGFDVTYSNHAQDEVIYREFPEVDTEQLAIRPGDDAATFVAWSQTELLFRGVSYTVRGGRPEVTTGTWYMKWSLMADDLTRYTFDLVPATTNEYLIATVAVVYDEYGLDGSADPTYYTKAPADDDWTLLSPRLTTAHNIELTFVFGSGLFALNDEGSLIWMEASLFAQYREVDTETWTNFHILPGEMFESFEDYGTVRAGVVKRADNKQVYVTVRATGNDSGVYLDPATTYEVRVAATSPKSVTLLNMAGIIYSEPDADGNVRGFSYPGEALIGIRALATGQLSGDVELSLVATRSTVPVYNPSSGWDNDAAATAHGWAVYDILANGHPDHPAYPNLTNDVDAIMPVYGSGLPATSMDYDSFRSWVEYVNSTSSGLGYELNIVFDTFTTAWDAILRICQEGRGIIYPSGNTFYAVVDKAVTGLTVNSAAATDITHLFSMGNITLGTFRSQWTDPHKTADSIEVAYWDADRDHARTQFAILTSDWDDDEALKRPVNLVLQGTTDYSQAFALGKYYLNCNELLRRIVTFDTGYDSIDVNNGDVVLVQHDTVTGAGGRVKSVRGNRVVNASFETGSLDDWLLWANPTAPSTRERSAVQAYVGTYSYHHVSTATNSGAYQRLTVKAATTYTLSAYFYPVTNTSIRVMARVVNAVGVSTYLSVSPSGTGAWERDDREITTGPTQTALNIYVGGQGECYFDAVMLDEGTTLNDFTASEYRVTLDRDVTVPGAGGHLTVMLSDGTLTRQLVSGGGTTSVIAFGHGRTWTLDPRARDVWAFGAVGADALLFRVIGTGMGVNYARTFTCLVYDARVYKTDPFTADTVATTATKIAAGDYAPGSDLSGTNVGKMAPNLSLPDLDVFTTATGLRLREVLTHNRSTGEYESSIEASWEVNDADFNGEWEVSYRDVDASDLNWIGEWATGVTYGLGDKVYHNGGVFVSTVENNTEEPA